MSIKSISNGQSAPALIATDETSLKQKTQSLDTSITASETELLTKRSAQHWLGSYQRNRIETLWAQQISQAKQNAADDLSKPVTIDFGKDFGDKKLEDIT